MLRILDYDIKDRKALYTSSAIRLFGVGMIAVFLPAILYNQAGLSLSQFFVFLAIYSGATLVLELSVTAKIINRFGTKIAMLLGIPFLMAYFGTMPMIAEHHWLMYLTPIFGGIFTGFFWPAFHLAMSQNARSKNFGTKVARLHIIITIVGAIAPLIGGWILDNYNESINFWIASTIIGCSLIPLIMSAKKHHTIEDNTDEKLHQFIKKNIKKRHAMSFASRGYVEMAGKYIRPFIIFLFVKSYTTMGIISMATTLFVVILIYLSGRVADQHKENKTMKFSVGIQSTNWLIATVILIFSAFGSLVIGIVDILHRFTHSVNSTLITKTLYDIAGHRTKTALFNVILHEIVIHGGRVIFSLLLALMFYLREDPKLLRIPMILVLIAIPLQFSVYWKSRK